MLAFDPDDPFPLLADPFSDHAAAQEHGEQVDAWLGLDTAAGVDFCGFELVAPRVAAAQAALDRFGAARARMVAADLAAADFSLCAADVYFMYDYGTRDAIEKTLADLRAVARERGVIVVGRGRACRDAIERRHPWLSGVVSPQHFAHASIYRTSPRDLACRDFGSEGRLS